MSWTLLLALAFVLVLGFFATLHHQGELRRMRRTLADREEAKATGRSEAQLDYPVIDLSRCLGCGTCVAVCPEGGVLELVHGQAMVVNGVRCMGIAACERECPVEAITITLANAAERRDVPVLDERLQAVGSEGLFLAGEVTARALIKTAIDHGRSVADEVARRVGDAPADDPDAYDLVIVGAGPAGLSCALQAQKHGLRHVVLEKEAGIGGTVASYPRRKLVLTQPVEMPLVGRLKRSRYSKEELMELWEGIAVGREVPVEHGVVLDHVAPAGDGHWVVHTDRGEWRARNVCLALGRRGVPRKLGVPGEELSKVAYSLVEASAYEGRRILVVGGGDSAVEAAVALAEHEGNEVTISYRRGTFFRLKQRNQEHVDRAIAERRVRALFDSEVLAIADEAVELEVGDGGTRRRVVLPNDDVFVMIGGEAPIPLLERSGVSFDPALRPSAEPVGERGTGLLPALKVGLVLTLVALAFALWHSDYYLLPGVERPTHEKHQWLRPGRALGLGFGLAAVALILANLSYLLRRAPRFRLELGSLRTWMTVHVATGVLALLCTMLHAGMDPGDSPGGRAFWALALLVGTGAIGRYFYSYVPRAANGRELELAEVRAELGRQREEWAQGQREFRRRALAEVEARIEGKQWRGSFLGRLLSLAGMGFGLRRLCRRLAHEGRGQGVPEDQVQETLALVRVAHRSALMAGHYEDLRALLGAWRWLHRWVTALMLLLLVVHIVHALTYAAAPLSTGLR
ncbi:MAG: FAD-dependent oxidoreductase [Planctomycetota bacterium]